MHPLGYLFLGFAALVLVAAIFAWRARRARILAMQQMAEQLGFSFDTRHDSDHDERYAQFAIFRRGDSRSAYNTLRGRLELFGRPCRVQLGDFQYDEDSGIGDSKSTTTYTFSYLLVHPPWPSPSLVVRPEGLLDKLKGAFGFDDIDFESEEFSSAFFVQSDDKRFAYDVLHPRMMEFLLAERPPMLEIEHGVLCLADGRRDWRPETFRQHLDFVRRFCELWPRHLVHDLAG